MFDPQEGKHGDVVLGAAPTAFDWATFVIACVGAATGIAAAAWAVTEYALVGGRIRVGLQEAWFGPDGILLGEIGWSAAPPAPAMSRCYAVAVTNVGRTQVQVTAANLTIGPSELLPGIGLANEPMPHVLGSGQRGVWLFDADYVEMVAGRSPAHGRIRAVLGAVLRHPLTRPRRWRLATRGLRRGRVRVGARATSAIGKDKRSKNAVWLPGGVDRVRLKS